MPPPLKTDLRSIILAILLIATFPAADALAPPEERVKPPEASSDRAAVTVPATSKAEPALPAGQVWECTVNGQKTFSDKRCGAAASVRQINDINRMDPTPAGPIHFYGSPNPNYPPPGAEPEERVTQDNSEQIYSTPPVIVVNRRGIAQRSRPHPHHHSQAHR